MKKRSAITHNLQKYFYPTAFALSFRVVFTVLFYSLWSTSVEHERFRVSRELELVGYEVQSILMEDERYFLIRGEEREAENWDQRGSGFPCEASGSSCRDEGK